MSNPLSSVPSSLLKIEIIFWFDWFELNAFRINEVVISNRLNFSIWI